MKSDTHYLLFFQPYRTRPLVSPTAKPLPKTTMGQKDKNSPLNVQTLLSGPISPKCPMLKTQEAAQVVSEALSHKQVSAEAYRIYAHLTCP